MTTDRTPTPPTVTNRQKIIAIIFVIILVVIVWQIWGLLKGDGSATTAPTSISPSAPQAPSPLSPVPSAPQQMVPQPANVPRPQLPMSQRESDMMRMQQESEAKYVATLNELQMLRLERDIAETNRAIMAAKLETVTAEKNIVNLLQPPQVTPNTYARGLANPVTGGTQAVTPVQTIQRPPATTTTTTTQVSQPPAVIPSPPDTGYSVISVSQVQSRWSAVVGFQGNLYSVYTGDVLPPDGSKVMRIDRSGVVLERNNIKRKVSLVPII